MAQMDPTTVTCEGCGFARGGWLHMARYCWLWKDEPWKDEPWKDEPLEDEPLEDEPLEDEPMRVPPATPSLEYAVAWLVYAVPVLALVYLYLVGLIDRGGTKTYSPGSRVFSSTFVSIVLVLAFYVWFKSRDPASRRGYRRRGHDKIEARYKPPGAKGNFSLGFCADDEEAGIKREIAACLYGRHRPWLHVKDREDYFSIPLTPSVPANLDAKGKEKWVKARVKQVYEEFLTFTAGLPDPSVQQVEHDPSVQQVEHDPSVQQVEHDPSVQQVEHDPSVQQVEHDPSVAFDPASTVEDMDFLEDLAAMIDLPDLPDLPDAETQLVHDNQVSEAMITVPNMSDNPGDGYFDHEPPGPGTSWVSAMYNAVHEISSEVAVGGLANGGAARDIPQSNSCEIPPTLRPSRECPANFEFFQQHSAPIAGLSNVVKPSVVHLCQPQNSTLDLQLALKLIRSLEQQNEEKDRRIAEQARIIVELKRENERLTSNSQH